jgi:hypothetical protein
VGILEVEGEVEEEIIIYAGCWVWVEGRECSKSNKPKNSCAHRV